MVPEYVYSPHVDFYIDRADRPHGYEMVSFHTHHKFELYYELEGTRRYFIEDAAYIVNAGSAILIGENQIHKTAAVGDAPSSRIVINFSAEYLEPIVKLFPGVDFFSFLSEERNHLLSATSLKQQTYIQAILLQLLELRDDKSPEADALRRMKLATLLLELKAMCREQQAREGENGRTRNKVIDQVQAYIAEHYAEQLTLTGIANQFYISPYYLSRLFKKSINLSMVEYVNSVRIKAAQALIEKSNDSVCDIAEKCGFLTAAHFRRVFKEATGLSPQQYRQSYKRVNK